MAHHVEPMDVDCMDSDFDNKENTFHHSNVLPCTEKGYEELDVSELNMKLRYSMTPVSSPMSKSYTASLDNKIHETEDLLNCSNEYGNLTRSLNSTITKNDSVIKTQKSLPLQSLLTEQFTDGNGNPSVLRQLDTTITDNPNITVTVSGRNDIDENLSLPSSSSSALHTPEATTPTKEITKDGGSPIMRGLKSVLNMFRPSQSPISSIESDIIEKQEVLNPADVSLRENGKSQVLASTPIAAHGTKNCNSSKRCSPYKDSIVFNDDLEKELSWKDETTIIFSEEKIPVHKLFFQQTKPSPGCKISEPIIKNSNKDDDLNSTVEYMDISYNELLLKDTTKTELQQDSIKNEVSINVESDSEFVDCETTFTKNQSTVQDSKQIEEDVLLTAKSQNLDVSKDVSFTIDNSSAVNLPTTSYLAGMSFTDRDYSNNMKEPAHHLDFSKETIKILFDLEKFEENVSSKVESSDTNSILPENVPQNKKVFEPLPEIQEITTNIALENLKQEPKITESQENQLNISEEVEKQGQNANITQPTEPEMLDTSTTVIKTIQGTETLLESDNKNMNSQEIGHINQNHDYTNVICVVTVDSIPQSAYPDLKLREMQDLNKIESQNISDTATSEDTAVTVLSENLNLMQKDFVPSIEVLNVTSDNIVPESILALAQKPADIPLTDEKNQKGSLEIIPAEKLNITTPEMAKVMESENPSDIPLPDEDDVEKEIITCEILATTSIETASHMRPETLEITNASLELDVNEKIQELPDTIGEDKIRNNSIVSEILNTMLPEQAEGHPFEVLEVSFSPPKKDIIKSIDEKLVEISEESKIKNEELLPELSNMTLEVGSDMPFEAQKLTVVDSISDIIENVNKSLPETETAVAQLSDFSEAGNNNSKIELTKKFEGKPLEKSHESKIENEALLHELSNMALEIGSEAQELTSTDSKSDLFDTINKSSLGAVPESKGCENIPLTEVIPSLHNVLTLDERHEHIEHIANDATQIVNDSQCVTNTLYTTTTDNFAQAQNKTHNEAMNITRNKSLDHIHDLPDVVNETIAVTENNSQIPIETIDTVDIKKLEDLAVIPANSIANLEPPLENNLQIFDEKQSDTVSEKMRNNKEINDSDVEIRCDQPTETIANTLNVEHTEFKAIGTDEEILVSENNSPYVSLMAGVVTETETEKIEKTFEEIDNLFTKTSLSSSPPITSKGYNFNFDEMDDPFATKTKIRMSPSPDSPTKPIEIENLKNKHFEVPKKGVASRRKSQPPERKKATVIRKKFNTTFDASSVSKTSPNQIEATSEDVKNKTISDTGMNCKNLKSFDTAQIIREECNESKCKDLPVESDEDIINIVQISEKPLETSEENKSQIEFIAAVSSDVKNTSSSEQSTYYSAGASFTESCQSKNVFNLPEIDDMNFNPFATKSKMRQSPPPEIEIVDPFATKTKIKSSPDTSVIVPQTDLNCTIIIGEEKITQVKIDAEDKTETEQMEKNTSDEISDTTSSSKATENENLTTREINTEDEDTIEGPFLEADDVIDKLAYFEADNVDMMQFNDLPVQETDDNLEGGELFIDAEAFEFLLNQNKSNVVADSGKESLFLKFDPLFAKRISSDGVLAALSKVQKRQSTPTKPIRPSLKNEASPIAGPSTLNVTNEEDSNIFQESNEDINVTISKPMMVVTPAVNPAVTPRNKSITPTRSNRRSITFTSPAIAVIDRLLSMSGNSSLVGQDTTMTQANRDQTDADLALTQLRELLAEKEIGVYNLRSESKELKDRLATMESQVRILEADGQDRLKKINELNERLAEKTKINKSMAAVVEEYERTIASLIAETEQDKKRNAEERIRLINERDEQTAHLASMEVSFSDLHNKYEKSKQIIFACKANEDTYKKSIKDFQENLTKMQTNYEMLKQHATSKLNHANQELEKINRAHEAEVVKLNAMIKRKDLHITSLEETLAQKTKTNEELTAICDELINKVG